jgi:hypothetical protein
MEKFALSHTMLYAKGWYKTYDSKSKNKTIWDDLRVIMSLDDYSGDIMSKTDITYVILHQCQKLDVRAFKDLAAFATGISKDMCWKHGYVTTDHKWLIKDGEVVPEYDYFEAIVHYCLSSLRYLDKATHGKLPMPDYIKGLPRKNGLSNQTLKQFFA